MRSLATHAHDSHKSNERANEECSKSVVQRGDFREQGEWVDPCLGVRRRGVSGHDSPRVRGKGGRVPRPRPNPLYVSYVRTQRGHREKSSPLRRGFEGRGQRPGSEGSDCTHCALGRCRRIKRTSMRTLRLALAQCPGMGTNGRRAGGGSSVD